MKPVRLERGLRTSPRERREAGVGCVESLGTSPRPALVLAEFMSPADHDPRRPRSRLQLLGADGPPTPYGFAYGALTPPDDPMSSGALGSRPWGHPGRPAGVSALAAGGEVADGRAAGRGLVANLTARPCLSRATGNDLDGDPVRLDRSGYYSCNPISCERAALAASLAREIRRS